MKHGVVYWFTGLSGSGKSTLCSRFAELLKRKGLSCHIFDGDDMRARLNIDLGFSPEGIKENNRLITQLVDENQGNYDVILVSVITPFEESRRYVRSVLKERYNEVYVRASLEAVKKRDPKGHYEKAMRGEIRNFVGIDPGTPFEIPSSPDIILDTEKHSVDDCLTLLARHLETAKKKLNSVRNFRRRPGHVRNILRKGLAMLWDPSSATQRIAYNMKRLAADLRYRSGRFNYPERLFFIAGAPLSGSTWVKNLLAEIPGIFTRPTPMPRDIAYRSDICDSAFKKTPGWGNTLFKTHLNPTDENLACLERNGVNKIVITYRDFRDAAVSMSYRLLDQPRPKKAFNYINATAVSKEALLNYCIESMRVYSIPWVKRWLSIASDRPNRYHVVRYEDLRLNTQDEFNKLLCFYGVRLPEEQKKRIVEQAKGKGHHKGNMRKSKVQPWGLASNFRKGSVGEWREEFSRKNIKLAKDLLGEMLIELGYEENMEWAFEGQDDQKIFAT